MKTIPLELSKQVRRSRYANFSMSIAAPSGLFMVGYEECAPDYIIERSGFPFWTLECVVGGHGFFHEGKVMRRLRNGAVFTYGPGVVHRFGNESERPFRKYFLVSGETEFPAAWRDAGLAPGRTFQLGSVVPVISILDQMLDEGQQIDAQTAALVTGLEAVLFALIARHKATVRGDKSASRRAYDLVVDILQDEYRELHTLSDLAARAGYSPEYLCRIFKKYHGDSPYQVLLHRKMSAAWLLLRDGQYQVGAVARELGYEDPLHFSRTFRKIMGCSPSSVQAR